jgi:hypothetical protein
MAKVSTWTTNLYVSYVIPTYYIGETEHKKSMVYILILDYSISALRVLFYSNLHVCPQLLYYSSVF